MAENSYPFDTSGVSTPSMGEDQWRRWARVFTPDGVQGGLGSTGLLVSINVSGTSIDIASGFANVQGALYNNDATLNKTNTANGGGSARPDRVVLRYDQTANSIVAVVREGTVGGAAPPTLTQAVTGQWDVPLARWSRAAGGSIGSLVDERQFMDRSGTLWMPDAAITTGVPLTALVPSPWVGMRVATDLAKEYRWSGGFWERVDDRELLGVSDTNLIAPTNTTFGTATSTAPSGTFVAPMSGRIKVVVSAFLRAPAASPGAANFTYFSARITGPAGYDNLPGETGPSAVRVGGTDGFVQATVSTHYFLSGLTAGSVYTATGVHAVSGSSGHQQIDNRRITVERA